MKDHYLSRQLKKIILLIGGATLVLSPVLASDIDIYQYPKAGDITLMFMLDISGSMTATDSTGKTRIARVQTAMIDLLQGNTTKGITKISDDKVIGLSTLGAYYYNEDYYTNRRPGSSNQSGAILVPARRLDAIVNGQTQRQILINAVNSKLVAKTATPTSLSYAEVVAYLMGTTTGSIAFEYYSSNTSKNSNYTAYQSPSSLTQTSDQQICSGQGVYVLTDGEPNEPYSWSTSASYYDTPYYMRSALGNKGDNFSCNGSWDCVLKISDKLVNKDLNPKGLKFKTAVVGFGSEFTGLNSYDRTKSQSENLAALGTINTNAKKAAQWGILGEGGWYSGNDSADVVESVNNFISDLASDIPAVTTGSATVPIDQLNPIALQAYAYYPQFQPTPDKNYQLWQGNVKKYNVVDGLMKDVDNKDIVDTKGLLLSNTTDLWAKNVSDTTLKGLGGIKANLSLRFDANDMTNRNILINRAANGTETSTSLTKLDIKNVFNSSDADKAYLLAMLGFKINPSNMPSSLSALKNLSELRQVGAVMHSSPVLVTNGGTITDSNDTTDREDYILFGTTQGMLHVVDASTGKEKFVFVPNEMVTNQKTAFLDSTMTAGGISNLFYGVDGPWTLYSKYVYKDNKLTVGSGFNNTQGTQIAYGGLRMGGRSYYALNLQNINDPKLLFRIDPESKAVYYNNTKTSVSALGYMGQSWSKPTIGWVKFNGTKRLVMFVGGGYDTGYESAEYEQTTKKGAGVYMFDANTGELLWWSSANATSNEGSQASILATDMKYSVVSPIRTVDRDNDGLIDNLYFGDLGGQVWRVDLNSNAASKELFAKTPVRLLNLNKGKYSPRFYEMPAFSTYTYANKKFAVISVGSGNRSAPLFDATVPADGNITTYKTAGYNNDAVYNIYDKDVARDDLFQTTTVSNKVQYASLVLNTKDLGVKSSGMDKKFLSLISTSESTATNRDDSTVNAPYSSSGGWYYYFSSYKLQSAKVLATPKAADYLLYTTVFDSSKAGQSGDCGAGVKGESFTTMHCLPFGQCTSTYNSKTLADSAVISKIASATSIGTGIQDLTVTGGDDSDPNPNPKPSSLNNCIDLSKANRYLTSSQEVLATVKGKVCFIPQKWYEQN